MNKVLVVAVHPDDETLGCGGTLLKHKENNDQINWLICTDLNKQNAHYEKREQEIKEVSRLYNFNSIHKLGLETTKVDEYQTGEIINKISNIINELKPNIIYLPFKNDVHSDHRKIFEAAYSCTKSFRYPFIKKIYMMETLSETEFVCSQNENFIPTVFSDITKYFSKKLEIMKIYESELEEYPFPRSLENIEAIAKFRGCTSNCKYAESFVLLKEIS
jgi:LmbE family N-acetylglucosaminyl deacetylase